MISPAVLMCIFKQYNMEDGQAEVYKKKQKKKKQTFMLRALLKGHSHRFM
jgi:hypothetical protein